MADISKHHSEEEWESDGGEYAWVYLFVAGDPISVCDLLSHICVAVGGKGCRRLANRNRLQSGRRFEMRQTDRELFNLIASDIDIGYHEMIARLEFVEIIV